MGLRHMLFQLHVRGERLPALCADPRPLVPPVVFPDLFPVQAAMFGLDVVPQFPVGAIETLLVVGEKLVGVGDEVEVLLASRTCELKRRVIRSLSKED